MRRFGPLIVLALVAASPVTQLRAQPPAELELYGRPESSLGPEIGASGTSALGGGGGIVGGRLGPSAARAPYNISQPGGWARFTQPQTEILPPPSLRAAEAPAFGSLEIPVAGEEEGPADGLTLDDAIEILVHESLDLRAKAMELPQAQADILTAGLRNPLIFADSQLIPYGHFDPINLPGGQTQYDINFSIPLDITRKRHARTAVAVQAKRVLHAQYQDAVRQAIDNLYTAFVDVLAARETVRFSRTSVAGLDKLLAATQAQQRQTLKTQAEVNQMLIQRDAASLGLMEATAALQSARRALGTQLSLPLGQAALLEVRGRLRDSGPEPPAAQELVPMALSARPDLSAYRLGMNRAQADARLARANWMQDVYLIYQPFTLQDNRQYGPGVPNATGWALGMTMAVPLFDRNQGNIRRSQLNIQQTQLELLTLERAIAAEVEEAHQQYETSKRAIGRIETTLIPAARQVLEVNLRLYQHGETDLFHYLAAQREYNELVRQYRDTLVSHRRSMLRLNTVAGQRILP